VTTLFFRNVDKIEIEAQDLLASYIQKSKRPRIILSASCPDKLNDTLFYLASGATIEMPSLISMGRDVLIILEYFLRDASARFGKRLPLVEDDTVKSILRHNWPGNARELRTVSERMVLGLPLNFEIRPQALTDLLDYDTAMMQFERNLLEQTLRETAGRKGEAAKLLMIPRKRLYLRLKSVGLLKTGHN
jgi:two-component system C4-dicarboxylate transport response regulator DctD